MSTSARRTLELAMSESAWTATVIGTDTQRGLARTFGWTCIHVNDSRKEVVDRRTGEAKLVGDKDAAGLPDWRLLRDRSIDVELKKQRGKLTTRQREILALIWHAGCEAYVWQPSDYGEAAYVLSTRDWNAHRGRAASRLNLERHGVLK